MEPVIARKMWRTLEPYHSFVYLAPEALELDYFATRAAPMGPVPPDVVVATFFNFAPRTVANSVPRVWGERSPADWTAARLELVDRTLRGVLGDVEVTAEAATLARAAAEACEPAGRALFAGHAGLAWPDEPHLVLWHAVTLLREYRGDGHVAALTVEGLDGCEALVLHAAAGEVPRTWLQGSRGWTDLEWESAEAWLRERGWIDETGALSDTGRATRDRYEELTDVLALPPWEALGGEACDRLRSLVRPFSRAIIEAGLVSLGR